MQLSELKEGQSARVVGFNQNTVKQKLMEMGCLSGVVVKRLYASPGGDPVAFELEDYVLSMRLSEAATVNVEEI